jgi:GDPmannose 4,6-dehydratase
LVGDPSKAYEKLGWKPTCDLEQLISEMVKADLELFKKDKYLMDGGHSVMNYHE